MGDDYFFAAPSSQSGGGPPPQAPAGGPAASSGPAPGMPGYSWHQHEQLGAPVSAGAGAAVALSAANAVAAVGALGGLLMVVGGWAPWVKASFAGLFNQSVGGLHGGLNGGLVLGLGLAALLAAGTAVTAQSNLQVRRISAGALVLLGVVGLIVVIHDWTTLSDRIRETNALFKSLLASQPGGIPGAPPGFDAQFHVAKAWGLMLSGVASVVTGLAGAYLFLVKP